MSEKKMTKLEKRLNKTQRDGLEIKFPKRVFVLWFHYVQFINDKKGVYEDWNIKEGQKFDVWWERNWKRLFSESIRGVKKIQSIPKREKGVESIYLEVPINKTQGDLVSEFEKLIKTEYKERGINKQKVFDSEGMWIPEVTRQFDYNVCKLNLECLKRHKKKNLKTGKKYTRSEIGLELKIHQGGDKHNRERMVSRHIQNGKKTLELVKKGRFK